MSFGDIIFVFILCVVCTFLGVGAIYALSWVVLTLAGAIAAAGVTAGTALVMILLVFSFGISMGLALHFGASAEETMGGWFIMTLLTFLATGTVYALSWVVMTLTSAIAAKGLVGGVAFTLALLTFSAGTTAVCARLK